MITTLSLFIGWHGSSKRGAWQLCRPRGGPSSLAQAWGCQVAFSKDHVNTMSVPCQYHVNTMSTPCQDHVSTMSTPCQDHVSTTCQNHVRTMPGPCQYTPHPDVSSIHCAYPEASDADCMSGPATIFLGQCEHSTRCCSIRGSHQQLHMTEFYMHLSHL